MSEPVVGGHQGPLTQHHTNGHAAEDKSPLPLPPNMIIEITEQRKKKQVISIEDSEQEHPRSTKPTRPKERKPFPDPRKARKLAHRCLLCKEPGKKSTMRACLDCHGMSHLSCLEQEGESSVRYRCRKCRHRRAEAGTEGRKGQKGEKAGEERAAVKKLQKEKRREEQQKKMSEFQLRYPYYFQDDKIRFPIEDKLLFIYRQLFEFAEAPKPRPKPHELIPTPLLAELLQIENFFSTFRQELVAYGTLPGELNKSVIYLSLEGVGLDGIFCSLVECLLKIYLSDIFDKNKTDNVRILNDHPFFTLLTHLHDNTELNQQVIVRAAPEVLRYLATVPSMRRAFEPTTDITDVTLAGKVGLLLGLIRGLSEVDQFHSLVSIKSQRMQLLTKEKTELVAQLKVDEAQNLSNNEKLKDMTQAGIEMEQTQEGVTRQLTKELDKHKKKMQRLATQQTKTEETIRDIRNKIAEIGRTMPFLTSQIEFLGLDRNNSEYFFYVREPDRLYVKFRSYFLDTSEHFLIYSGKEAIAEVLRSLNTKGLHERHLYDNIISLMKDEIFCYTLEPSPASNFILEENKYTLVTMADVISLIKETQATFSVYLSVRQFQWAAPTVRELFMAQLETVTDLHILKEQLRSLQESFLFAEYSTPEGATRGDMEQQEGQQQLGGRKKVPIRIWGINSEKTKKYWVQYLQECIDAVGVWLCAYVFKNNVDKYVKKKMDAYYGQQIKDNRPRPRARGRPPLNRQDRIERMDRIEKDKKSSSVNEPSAVSEEEVEIQSEEEFDQEEEQARRPNLRKRSTKKMNIVRGKVTQDSDVEIDLDEPEDEDSSNQEMCEICGDYGEMICCDTCPKVYHKDCLKIKDVPEGEWSCFKCLEKLSNERQTRSRVKRMGKFM